MGFWLEKTRKWSCQLSSWHLGRAVPVNTCRDALFCVEVVVLEDFSFVPFLFSQDHFLPAVVEVLEEGLIPSPDSTLCGSNGPGMLISRPFPLM